MRKLIVLFVAIGLAFLVYRKTRPSAPPDVAITAGERQAAALKISVTDVNGNQLRTAQYKGKVLLVNFWAAWCTPCAEEVPQFIALERKYHDQGLQVIGFSVDDDVQELRDFTRKYGINYPVAPSDFAIAEAFGGVFGLPTTLVIDRDGSIRRKHYGATDFSSLEQEVVALLRAPSNETKSADQSGLRF